MSSVSLDRPCTTITRKWKLTGLLKCEIEEVLRRAHPGYGYRQIATTLVGERRSASARLCAIFGIKPYRRRGRRWRKARARAVEYPNLLLRAVPIRMHEGWVADCTHLAFHGGDVCVATVMDIYTRIIVGLQVLTNHGTILVTQALWSALLSNPRPTIFHSDNGREYNALAFREILETLGVSISRSKKGCPWENGYQESFYGKFKVELGDPNRFSTLGELVAEIYRAIHYYNTERIHSAFDMPPRTFAKLHASATLHSIVY